MVSHPGISLILRPADNLKIIGPHAERVRAVVGMLQASEPGLAGETMSVQIEVSRDSADHHVGLGTGTQLALSVAEGLREFFGLKNLQPVALAQQVNRGKRSSIGAHGYFQGGFLVDGGKPTNNELSPLVKRVEFPQDWCFLLICPNDEEGVSGQMEKDAMERLPPFPLELTTSMCQEVTQYLLPALAHADFDIFSEHLYRYGMNAGRAFASEQKTDTFRNRRVAEIVYQLRQFGVKGVGQTSWGPTVFALFSDQEIADHFLTKFCGQPVARNTWTVITPPANTGRRIA